MKLDRFSAAGRYPGVYVHPSRGEVGATDGHAFVVLGASSIEEARDLLLQCREPDCAPTTTQAARVLTSALGPRPASVEVTSRTAPDPTLRKGALAVLVERAGEAEAWVSRRAAELDRARAEGRGGVGAAREALAAARTTARERRAAATRADTPACHAVLVGAAAVDLRLVRRCLTALGATQGTLSSGGALEPCVLVTRTGLALVMPFRQ